MMDLLTALSVLHCGRNQGEYDDIYFEADRIVKAHGRIVILGKLQGKHEQEAAELKASLAQ